MITPSNDTAPTPAMPHASSLFAEALSTINGPRKASYGNYTDEAKAIAAIWSALLRQHLHTPIPPRLVPLLMIGLKINREANAHKHDNLTDLAGYTGLLAELEAETLTGEDA